MDEFYLCVLNLSNIKETVIFESFETFGNLRRYLPFTIA